MSALWTHDRPMSRQKFDACFCVEMVWAHYLEECRGREVWLIPSGTCFRKSSRSTGPKCFCSRQAIVDPKANALDTPTKNNAFEAIALTNDEIPPSSSHPLEPQATDAGFYDIRRKGIQRYLDEVVSHLNRHRHMRSGIDRLLGIGITPVACCEIVDYRARAMGASLRTRVLVRPRSPLARVPPSSRTSHTASPIQSL